MCGGCAQLQSGAHTILVHAHTCLQPAIARTWPACRAARAPAPRPLALRACLCGRAACLLPPLASASQPALHVTSLNEHYSKASLLGSELHPGCTLADTLAHQANGWQIGAHVLCVQDSLWMCLGQELKATRTSSSRQVSDSERTVPFCRKRSRFCRQVVQGEAMQA